MAACRSGNGVGAYRRSYSTSDPVSTEMGDRRWTVKQPGVPATRPTQPPTLRVTGNEYRLGVKDRMVYSMCG